MFADIQNVRFAADANSYCGGRVARRPVKDRILPAHVADGVCADPSQFGHGAKGGGAFRSVDQCRVPGPSAAVLVRSSGSIRCCRANAFIRHRPLRL